MKTILAAAALTLLAACQGAPQQSAEPERATAVLQPTKGSKAQGEATFEEEGGIVHAFINVQGLKPGQAHGLHIHEVGDCSAPDAMSAKGHFNPAGKLHGNPASAEHHAGDLPALQAGRDGHAKLDTMIEAATLSPGPNSIVGRAVVIHADPDDYKTQPTGNSGTRIACGVIRPG